MIVYFFDELMEMSVNELLDLLSSYIKLRTDICEIIRNDDMEMKSYYVDQYLYFYLLNISKIKSTLSCKLENDSDELDIKT